MSESISFLHAGGIGDIVYALPAVLSVLRKNDIPKARLYLELGREIGYSGWHPLGTKLLDQAFAERLVPLLKSQSYVADAKVHAGEKIDVDLNGFRRLPINPTMYCIPRWYFLFLVGTSWDLSQPWLRVEPDYRFGDRVLVSRNPRLRSPHISYGFMNDFAESIVFVGVQREFEEFRKECPRCESLYEAPDFLELARVVAGARFFCGNQGFVYTLAEAMKTPRLLETNDRAANNVPMGPHCYDALFARGFVHWFEHMWSVYPPRRPAAAQ